MSVEGSVLSASLTINVCIFSYFTWGRLIAVLSTRYGEKYNLWGKIAKIHKKKPWLLGKMMTELLVTCILFILSVTALSTTSVSGQPFKSNSTEPFVPIIQNVISINIGRYVYMSVQNAFLHEHLRHFVTNLIHHVVTTGAYSIFILYQQNVFLSVASVLMEVNMIPLELARILREAGVVKDSILHRRLSVVSCAVTITSRGVMPVVFLALALKDGSPFTMEIAPLTMFFMCIVFFFVVNFWMIVLSIMRVVRYSPCGMGPISNNTINYVTNQMQPQSRDISLSDNEDKKQCIAFSDLNYGYSKPYDNRNICNGSEKNNVGTKSFYKPNVLCKNGQQTLVFARTESPSCDLRAVPVPEAHNNQTLSISNISPRNNGAVHIRTNHRVRFEDEVAGADSSSSPTDSNRSSRSSSPSSLSSTGSTSILIQSETSTSQTFPCTQISHNNAISNSGVIDIPVRTLGGAA